MIIFSWNEGEFQDLLRASGIAANPVGTYTPATHNSHTFKAISKAFTFDRIDSNKDGIISPEEVVLFVENGNSAEPLVSGQSPVRRVHRTTE